MVRLNRQAVLGALLASQFLACGAQAQGLAGPLLDEARDRAQRQAAEAAARAAAPNVRLAPEVAPLPGAAPVEIPCFVVDRLQIEGDLRALGWVEGFLAPFEDQCLGQQGLGYVVQRLNTEFLRRGLVTTRAGLPAQDLSDGVLRIGVAPGTIGDVRGPSARALRAWTMAFPQHKGEILNLRAVEQGLEQVRRVPRNAVKIDIDQSQTAGPSDLILTFEPARRISGTVGLNNFSGRSVGRWQGSASLSGVDLLGVNDLWTLNYNSRIASPAPPASSQGSGLSVSLPYGWWTFSLAAGAFDYAQQINGEIVSFESTGRSRSIDLSAERVFHRDQASRSSWRAKLSRRSSRSYIEGVEIGLQRQELTDYEIALIDRRGILGAQFNTLAAWRQGAPWFGAQDDQPGRPSDFPTTRYRIATLEVVAQAPINRYFLTNYRAELRGQWSDTPLFGSDLFAVGGPFSVRGFDSDQAVLGQKGWFLRQEISAKPWRGLVQPYALLDTGQVAGAAPFMAGAGLGVRAGWRGLSLDAFVAAPLAGHKDDRARIGLSAGCGF